MDSFEAKVRAVAGQDARVRCVQGYVAICGQMMAGQPCGPRRLEVVVPDGFHSPSKLRAALCEDVPAMTIYRIVSTTGEVLDDYNTLE